MILFVISYIVFFFKQKTAYEMRISDWSSDVCSSDLPSPLSRLRSSSAVAAGLPNLKVLNHARLASLISEVPIRAPRPPLILVEGGGFEPPYTLVSSFTVCPRSPLAYPSAQARSEALRVGGEGASPIRSWW